MDIRHYCQSDSGPQTFTSAITPSMLSAELDRLLGAMNFPMFKRKYGILANLKRLGKWAVSTGSDEFNRRPSILMLVSQMACSIAERSGNSVAASYLGMVRNVLAVQNIASGIGSIASFYTTPVDRTWFKIQHTELVGTGFEDTPLTKLRSNIENVMSVSPYEKSYLYKFAMDGKPIEYISRGAMVKVTPVSTNIESCTVYDGSHVVIQMKDNDTSAMPYVCVRVGDIFITYLFTHSGSALQVENVREGRQPPMPVEDSPAMHVLVVNFGKNETVPKSLPIDIIMGITRQYIDTEHYVYSFMANSTLSVTKRPEIPYKPLQPQFESAISSYKTMFDKRLHRGICFVGGAGCGKSTLMRQISNRMPGCMTIQMTPTMLENDVVMGNLFEFITAMRDVIILCDDLDGWIRKDKDKNISRWIGFFDRLNEMHASDDVSYLFCCTMNDPSLVNSTIVRRSGRIDEVVEISGVNMEQLDYLLTTYDREINGDTARTNFFAEEFTKVKNEILNMHLTPADIYNMFTHISIDCEFDGCYTPTMLGNTLALISHRNRLTQMSYLDENRSDVDACRQDSIDRAETCANPTLFMAQCDIPDEGRAEEIAKITERLMNDPEIKAARAEAIKFENILLQKQSAAD